VNFVGRWWGFEGLKGLSLTVVGGVNVDPELDLQGRAFYCCGSGCRPRFGVVNWGVLVGYAKSLVKQLFVRG